MLLVPKIYAEIALGSDFVILITSLLFRKPKRRTGISSLDPKSTKYVGYYIIGSAIGVLVVAHYALFPSYIDYLRLCHPVSAFVLLQTSVLTHLTSELFSVLPPTPR